LTILQKYGSIISKINKREKNKMGMSSWIMDLEDKYWDTVATIVSESETFQEAESSAKSLAKTEVPFLDVETISLGVAHLWNEFWSNYQ
tara:strand:+ start:155 stop:421 length:267 start_codon:yes stop_codon:yes gene_type:complete